MFKKTLVKKYQVSKTRYQPLPKVRAVSLLHLLHPSTLPSPPPSVEVAPSLLLLQGLHPQTSPWLQRPRLRGYPADKQQTPISAWDKTKKNLSPHRFLSNGYRWNNRLANFFCAHSSQIVCMLDIRVIRSATESHWSFQCLWGFLHRGGLYQGRWRPKSDLDPSSLLLEHVSSLKLLVRWSWNMTTKPNQNILSYCVGWSKDSRWNTKVPEIILSILTSIHLWVSSKCRLCEIRPVCSGGCDLYERSLVWHRLIHPQRLAALTDAWPMVHSWKANNCVYMCIYICLCMYICVYMCIYIYM